MHKVFLKNPEYFSLIKTPFGIHKKPLMNFLNLKQINNKNISRINKIRENSFNYYIKANKFQKSSKFYFIGSDKSSVKEKEVNIKDMTAKDIEKIRNEHISMKLDTIFKKEAEIEKKNLKEKEFVENKMRGITDKFNLIRIPIFFLVYPLAYSSPFSTTYSIILTISNNYAIFLTLFESSVFFSAGVLNYLLNFNELTNLKNKFSFKRLSTCVIFLSILLFAAKLSNSFLNLHSLILLMLMNFYLYIKLAYHIHLKLFTRDFIFKRMANIIQNLYICLLLAIIVYWKSNIYNQIVS